MSLVYGNPSSAPEAGSALLPAARLAGPAAPGAGRGAQPRPHKAPALVTSGTVSV